MILLSFSIFNKRLKGEYADIDSEESDTDLFTSEDIDTVIESIIESKEE